MWEIIIKPGTGHVQRSSLSTALPLSLSLSLSEFKIWKWSSIGKTTGMPQTIAGSGYDDLYHRGVDNFYDVRGLTSLHASEHIHLRNFMYVFSA